MIKNLCRNLNSQLCKKNHQSMQPTLRAFLSAWRGGGVCVGGGGALRPHTPNKNRSVWKQENQHQRLLFRSQLSWETPSLRVKEKYLKILHCQPFGIYHQKFQPVRMKVSHLIQQLLIGQNIELTSERRAKNWWVTQGEKWFSSCLTKYSRLRESAV